MNAASDAAARRAFPTGVTSDRVEGIGGDGGVAIQELGEGDGRAAFPDAIRPGENQAWRQRLALDSGSNEQSGDGDGRRCRGTASFTVRQDRCALRVSSSPPASCAPLLSSALLPSFSLRRTSCRRRRIPSTRSRASSSVPRMRAPRLPSRGPCRSTDALPLVLVGGGVGRTDGSDATGMPWLSLPKTPASRSRTDGDSCSGQIGRRLCAAREVLRRTPSTASRAGRPW